MIDRAIVVLSFITCISSANFAVELLTPVGASVSAPEAQEVMGTACARLGMSKRVCCSCGYNYNWGRLLPSASGYKGTSKNSAPGIACYYSDVSRKRCDGA